MKEIELLEEKQIKAIASTNIKIKILLKKTTEKDNKYKMYFFYTPVEEREIKAVYSTAKQKPKTISIDKAIMFIENNIPQVTEIRIEGLNRKEHEERKALIEELRERQRALMPQHMKEFEEELQKRKTVNLKKLSKTELIEEWIKCFDKSLINDDLSAFHKQKTVDLNEAFSWTYNHFAELDLGGNMKWWAVVQHVLKAIKNNEWSRQVEQYIIAAYLEETRWYQA